MGFVAVGFVQMGDCSKLKSNELLQFVEQVKIIDMG
jgi:hypothetical protein